MHTAGWKFVPDGPEVGDQGDLAPSARSKKRIPGCLLARLNGTSWLRAGLGHDSLHAKVPVVGETFDVEPDVGIPAADLLPGLGAAVDHVWASNAPNASQSRVSAVAQ